MGTRLPRRAGHGDIAILATWFLSLGVAYLFSVASDAVTELCYAAVFALAGTLLIAALHRADHRTFRLSHRAIFILARRALTGAVKECWLLLGPRLSAQLGGRAADGRYIRIAIDRGQGDPWSDGRVAGVLWVQALTPNAIPLFVDREHVVLHQLVRHREPNADDREFPT